jgi:hypothetical protein
MAAVTSMYMCVCSPLRLGWCHDDVAPASPATLWRHQRTHSCGRVPNGSCVVLRTIYGRYHTIRYDTQVTLHRHSRPSASPQTMFHQAFPSSTRAGRVSLEHMTQPGKCLECHHGPTKAVEVKTRLVPTRATIKTLHNAPPSSRVLWCTPDDAAPLPPLEPQLCSAVRW